MRRTVPIAAMLLTLASPAIAQAPVPGRNVNIVTVDPFLQKQNEPSIAVSTRNPCHLLAGANDYRTVNIPGLPEDKEIGDAWVGLYKSTNCGQTWTAELMPGFLQDTSPAGLASPVHGLTTAADPMLRASVSGTFFYSFIAFNRGTNVGKLALARFIDNNNLEAGDPFTYLGQTIIDSGSARQFVDKPSIAVARSLDTCSVAGQRIPATDVHVAYTVFTDPGTAQQTSRIMFARVVDCGRRLAATPVRLSSGTALHQGAAIAVGWETLRVFVVWRTLFPNGVMIARSYDGGRSFYPAQAIPTLTNLSFFDQGTTPNTFRTIAYPSVAVDHNGRVHVVISARGFGAGGDARIVHTSSFDGVHWTPAQAVDDSAAEKNGHQLMPALTYAGGRLNAVWYDLRDDYSQIFGTFVDESQSAPKRHTLDVRGAQAAIADWDDSLDPPFVPYGVLQLPQQPTPRVSQYLIGAFPGFPGIVQLQHNPPNLRLYAGGTAPFMGDYIDIAGLQFVPKRIFGVQLWLLNRSKTDAAFQAVWTDNRDAKLAPGDLGTQPYTPPGPGCVPGQDKSRNANVYVAAIGPGLTLAAPANTKPSNQIQRAFPLNIENGTAFQRTVRVTIGPVPAGTMASFEQKTTMSQIMVDVPAKSDAARTVYVTSTQTYPLIQIDAASSAVPASGSTPALPALAATAFLNRDQNNPTLQNPTAPLASPDPVLTTEVHNPDVANPDVANPDVANPDVANPDVANPDVANPDVANPDVANPDVANPDVANPDVANPDVANPDVANTDLTNGSLTDVLFEVTNVGNTTSSYQVKTSVNGDTNPFLFQMLGVRVYKTPSSKNCQPASAVQNQVMFNLALPDLSTTFLPANDPSIQNTTILVGPGETVKIVLRVFDPNKNDSVNFCAKVGPGCPVVTHAVTLAVKAQAANTGSDTPVVAVSSTDIVIDGVLAASPSTVVPGDQINLSGAALRNAGSKNAGGEGGFEYRYVLSADNIVDAGDLPLNTFDGVSLAAGQTLALADTVVIPAATPPGTYFIGLIADVNNDVSESNEQNNTTVTGPIQVVAAPVILTATLPNGQVGSTYSQTLAASGGVAPLTWSWAPAPCQIECAFTSATPPGLTLNNGTISGTPTSAGLFGFVVTVTDSTPGAAGSSLHSASRLFTMQVLQSPATGPAIEFLQQPPEALTSGSTIAVAVRVRDQSGAVIPGAQVQLKIADQGTATMTPTDPVAVTNADGLATFPAIQVSGTGSFRFSAIVNAAGFPQSEAFSNVFTLFASTGFAGPVGGEGGTPFGPILCPQGRVPTALRGRAGDDIDRTELWCSPLDGTYVGAPAPAGGVGGEGGADYGLALSCPAGSVMIGLHGRAGTVSWGGTVVDTLGVTCRNLATGQVFASGEVGKSANAPTFVLSCPVETEMVGIQGRQGALLDQIAIICR